MRHILLIHWHGEEAGASAGQLEELGYRVTCRSDLRTGPRALLDEIPDAFVIDLGRIPSQGRETGGWLRRRKATRHTPLVFVEGTPGKTQRVRDLLPDATFTTWESIDAALGSSIAAPPENPAIPGTMDAYAGASLTKKLGIKPGTSVVLVDAPTALERTLGKLPSDVTVVRRLGDPADVVCLFVRDIAGLDRAVPEAAAHLAGGGRLWIAWPKKSSGTPSDLSETVVREYGLSRGLVDYKIAAIDSTWSGLCFARRGRTRRDPSSSAIG